MRHRLISAYILKSIACSFLLLFALGASAQSHKKMVEQPKDTIPLWRGFQVKADLMGVVQRAVSSYGQYEVGLRFNLKDRFFPVIELGLGQADETDDVTDNHYKTSAPYGKIGIDFNVLKNKHDIYRLYAGLRYAYTSFKYDLTRPDVVDPVWGGTTTFAINDEKASWHWLEAVFGIDAKIYGPLHLGWSVRYRRRLAHNDGDYGNVWYVPGFGKQGGSRIGGTFDIIYEL